MTQYAVRNIATQAIESAIGRRDPDNFEGPLDAPPSCAPGYELISFQGHIPFEKRPSPTAVLCWNDTAPGWVEAGEVQEMAVAAVARCYADIDAIYSAAIGNRAVEYTDAEVDARAFVAGAEATVNITSFAKSNPTGQPQSNQWAAEQILARADAFKQAQVAMRVQRFDSQAAMRACTTPAQLAHVVFLWDQFISGLRTQLGL